jgi:hypothetical protein
LEIQLDCICQLDLTYKTVRETSALLSYYHIILHWGYTDIYKSAGTLNSPLHRPPLSRTPSIPGIVSTGLIFHFDTRVHNIPPYSPSFTLSLYPASFTGADPLAGLQCFQINKCCNTGQNQVPSSPICCDGGFCSSVSLVTSSNF